jgi:hypothetical protein
MKNVPKTAPTNTDTAPRAWQFVWRKGICPQLTDAGLQALKTALETDDPRLLQGSTTSPPPLQCVSGWPVTGCCPLCWALLDGEPPGSITVARLEERFAQACYTADMILGEPAAVRYWLNWVDETPRPQMLTELLAEVERELASRRRHFLVSEIRDALGILQDIARSNEHVEEASDAPK